MRKSAVVLGNFDGVHKAHAALIKNAVKVAGEKNLNAMAFMFDAHPKTVLGSFDKCIMTNDVKKEIIEGLGVQVVCEPLTKKLLDTSAEDFAKEYLMEKLSADVVLVGYDYSFGKGAKGTPTQLSALGEKYNFSVRVMPRMCEDGIVISSTAIRDALLKGDIDLANRLMTKPYKIRGRVLHGKGLGKRIGIPTANIYFEKCLLIPRYGVYSGSAYIDGGKYRCITNIGTNPTFALSPAHAESFILDFEGDLYDREITVELHSFIREEKKFSGIGELMHQVALDIDTLKNIE